MRTGKFLALDNFGVKADIYTLAKAAGCGLPIGITVTRTSLGDIPAGSHSNTFGGNLASIAAAGATLDYVRKNTESIRRKSRENGALIMKRLSEMHERYEIVGDVRGIGMMFGVELVKDKRSKAPAVMEVDTILKSCFENGLLLLPAGVSTIRIMPPLTMSSQNIERGLDIFEKAIKAANSRAGS